MKENIQNSPDKITKHGGSCAVPRGTSCSWLGGQQWIAIDRQQCRVWVSQELGQPLLPHAPRAVLGAAVGARQFPLPSADRVCPWVPPCTPPAHSSLAAGDVFCLRGPSTFKDTNFVVYRSVLGLRANLGRWPIFSSFSCLSPLASGDLERKHPSFQGKVSRENDRISSDRI